jgi:hypothetical protein
MCAVRAMTVRRVVVSVAGIRSFEDQKQAEAADGAVAA